MRTHRAEPLPVAIDETHALINHTGLGRYARELMDALRARPTLRLIPLRASSTSSGSTAGRIARGLAREGVYYPALLAGRARHVGASLLHLPTPAPVLAHGMALVVTVHDLLPLRRPDLFTRQTRIHTRLYAPFVRRAHRIITPSEYTRAEVIELLGVASERVVAIPHGLPSRFCPREPDRDALAEDLGIGGRYVLAAGTLEPRKNLSTALRAFARVADTIDDVELVIAGGRGWRNAAFEAALRESRVADRVRLTGFVSDERLVELYAGAACFVFPSLAEGFGLPPLEAMACGAPVIVGAGTALSEVIADAGLAVDATDAQELAAQMRRVLEDDALAGALRSAGLAHAKRFSWQRAAQATEQVYRDALAGV